MDIERIIKAWRSKEYRNSLSAEEKALLPASPVGEIDLSDTELQDVVGGLATTNVTTSAHDQPRPPHC